MVSWKVFDHWHTLCLEHEHKEKVETNNLDFQMREDAAMFCEERIPFLGKGFLGEFNDFQNIRPPRMRKRVQSNRLN